MKRLVPGLLAIAAAAILGEQLSGFIGKTLLGLARSPISPVMLAMLIGLVVSNTIGTPTAWKSGVSFGTKRLLRVGIILLGARLSVVEMARVFEVGFPVIVACVAIGLVLPHLMNRRLRLPTRLVTLISVGTSICGVSAIIATSESIEADKEHTAYAVATITLFGLLATVLYPVVARWIFGPDSLAAGLFLGTAIHDTSQVAGAAFLYQDYFADTAVVEAATVAKLLRNGLMIVVIPTVSILQLRADHAKAGTDTQAQRTLVARVAAAFPFFIFGFVLMSVVRSIGDQIFVARGLTVASFDAPTWRYMISLLSEVSSWCITMALGAVGLSTSFGVFKGLGLRPFVLGFFTAVVVGLTSVGAIYLVI